MILSCYICNAPKEGEKRYGHMFMCLCISCPIEQLELAVRSKLGEASGAHSNEVCVEALQKALIANF